MTAARAVWVRLGAMLMLWAAGCGDDSAAPGDPTAGASGGAGMTGGMTGGGGGGTGTGGTGGQAPDQTACTIESTVTMSTAISTVAIVEFTTDLAGFDAAHIEFGLDTSYGMQAPVDLSEPGNRTLLLGMKPAREYHYRVVAMAGDAQCAGPDNTLQTGPEPNQFNLIDVDIETPQPEKVNGGFTVTSFYTGVIFIMDQDGDYVWWSDAGSQISRARMSYDGRYMWARNGNPGGGESRVVRISMDGMEVEEFDQSSEFGDGHHDFTVMPDETVLFIGHGDNGCNTVVERSPDGTTREVINGVEVYGESDECWINSVHYFAEDDTITFSDRVHNLYAKVTRQGEVLWVLGGGDLSTFTSGDAIDWTIQHGHHVLSPERMLMFENGAPGAGSMAYEVELDEAAGSATRVWSYDGGTSSNVLGDVQRLPNGNTLVTYSTSGTTHEVDPEENLVQSMTWAIGGALSYSDRRASLYGPPPR